MKIIGITGSSGSGKSTITKILQKELNAKAIYADEVVKIMQKRGTSYFKEIVKLFGIEYLNENGELNRGKIAESIFKNKAQKEKLDNLTKKYVVKEIEEQLKSYKEEYIIIDAPLLIETGLNKKCDKVIAVISNKELQKTRICNRDKISESQALLRLQAQPDNDFYIKNVDYIIENNGGNYDKFLGRIRGILQELQKM